MKSHNGLRHASSFPSARVLSRFRHDPLRVTSRTEDPGSSVPGILQARILQWVAISFSRGLPDSGVEPSSLVSLASSGGFFTTSATWEFLHLYLHPPFSIWGPKPSSLYHYLHFHKKVLLYHNFLLKIVVFVQC